MPARRRCGAHRSLAPPRRRAAARRRRAVRPPSRSARRRPARRPAGQNDQRDAGAGEVLCGRAPARPAEVLVLAASPADGSSAADGDPVDDRLDGAAQPRSPAGWTAAGRCASTRLRTSVRAARAGAQPPGVAQDVARRAGARRGPSATCRVISEAERADERAHTVAEQRPRAARRAAVGEQRVDGVASVDAVRGAGGRPTHRGARRAEAARRAARRRRAR